MGESDWLAERFEENRSHLRAVAYRMLGSTAEADDAVQEAWLNVSRSSTSEVRNLTGWLTTVVARVCLDMLRSRKSRREDLHEAPEALPAREDGMDPEREAVLADSVGLALLVVLDALAPAERLAFVLHDMFGVTFEEIAPIVGRNATATRQLASRARRRVQLASAPETDLTRRREVVDAFFAASRGGDFAALLAVLDPEVVLRADAAAVRMGADGEVRGAEAVARTFSGRAQAAELALVDGVPAMIWAVDGKPRVVFSFSLRDGRISGIELLADPDLLSEVEITIRH